MAEMQNKFWGGASDSDDSDSNSGSDDSDDEQQQQQTAQPRQRAVNKYEIESDDDSEEEIRIVKKKKDKYFDALREKFTGIRNSIKINDWNSILDDFQSLEKLHVKALPSIKNHGIPGFYISALVQLSQAVDETFQSKPKMSKTNSKAFTRMRHLIKKSPCMSSYKKEIEACIADPSKFEAFDGQDADNSDSDSDSDSDSSDEDSSSDSDSDSDDEATKTKAKGSDSEDDDSDDSDSDSEQWDSDSSDESDDEDDVLDKRFTREFWVKKAVTEEDAEDEKEKRRLKEEAREARKLKERQEKEAREKAKAEKQAEEEEDMTPEVFDTRLRDILARRGKKSTNSREQIAILQKLAGKAFTFGPERLIPVQMHLITAQLDQLRSIDAVLSNEAWQSCVGSLLRVVRSLQANPRYRLALQEGTDMSAQTILANSESKLSKKLRAAKKKEQESGGENPASDDPHTLIAVPVVGDLGQYLSRLSREFDKSMRLADPHSDNYVKLLRNEATLLLLAKEVQEYYETEVTVVNLKKSLNGDVVASNNNPALDSNNPSGTTEESSGENTADDQQQKLQKKPRNIDMAALSALIRIEHIYYKHKSIAETLRLTSVQEDLLGNREFLHPASLGNAKGYVNTVAGNGKEVNDPATYHPGAYSGTPKMWMKHSEQATKILASTDMDLLMDRLCKLIYAVGDSQSKVRAMLCHIFYHALHDRFYQARDLLLMSHLQDSIMHTDIPTQVLFNRAMAQVGLCAFRHGLLKTAHDCLSEICFGNKAKELLAQGMQWRSRHSHDRRTEEEERAEKRRLLPFHLHINLDLLECCHLVSAAMLEIPAIAIEEIRAIDVYQDRWRVISKAFRRLRDNNHRMVFKGPPETPRDTVMASAELLCRGDWRSAAKLVMSLGIWDLIPEDNSNEGSSTLTGAVLTCEDEKLESIIEMQGSMTWDGKLVRDLSRVRQMLLLKFREVGLRTYLLTYSMFYDSMSLEELTKMFELPRNHMHALISKMMIAHELHASWDQTSDTIVMLKTEPSKLQSLALQFGDRAAAFVEANERMLDAETNLYRFEYDDDNHDGKRGYRSNYGGGRRGPKFKGRMRDGRRSKGRGRGRGRGRSSRGRGRYKGRGRRRDNYRSRRDNYAY